MVIDKILDQQYRRPSGLIGRFIGRRMARQHVPENAWTVALLDAQPADRILEIGFGPGIAIEALARVVTRGHVAGVDYSRAMVAAASRRNCRAIRAGRVTLQYGEVARLPFPDATFDKAYGIHTIYFWPDAPAGLSELHRVLRPGGSEDSGLRHRRADDGKPSAGGKLVLTILPKERWPAAPDGSLGTPECRVYSGGELIELMRAAGFRQTRIESDPDPTKASNYSVVGLA